jgi:hypothetical protein
MGQIWRVEGFTCVSLPPYASHVAACRTPRVITCWSKSLSLSSLLVDGVPEDLSVTWKTLHQVVSESLALRILFFKKALDLSRQLCQVVLLWPPAPSSFDTPTRVTSTIRPTQAHSPMTPSANPPPPRNRLSVLTLDDRLLL